MERMKIRKERNKMRSIKNRRRQENKEGYCVSLGYSLVGDLIMLHGRQLPVCWWNMVPPSSALWMEDFFSRNIRKQAIRRHISEDYLRNIHRL
jgi:hypothetical protein